MLCTRCGSIIKDGSPFCSYCNSPVSDSVPQYSGQPIIQSAPSYPVTQRNRAATVGLVFGIISMVLSVCHSIKGLDDSTSGMLIGAYMNLMILGIVFSSIGIKRGLTIGGRGKAITGLILSIFSFFMFIVSVGMG